MPTDFEVMENLDPDYNNQYMCYVYYSTPYIQYN